MSDLVQRVVAFLEEEGAVRDPQTGLVDQFRTAFEIAEACQFPFKTWMQVKEEILKKGYPLAYTPSKGHYLGFQGEEMRNAIIVRKVAHGWNKRAQRYSQLLPLDSARRAYLREQDVNWDTLVQGVDYGQD